MGILVCQACNATIDYVEDEKVTTLYSCCCDCGKKEETAATATVM